MSRHDIGFAWERNRTWHGAFTAPGGDFRVVSREVFDDELDGWHTEIVVYLDNDEHLRGVSVVTTDGDSHHIDED